MSYADSRDADQLKRLAAATEDFITRWQAKPPGTNRRTLFLLPGGLASALWRATTPYDDNGPPIQTFQYELNWMTPCSFLDTATELAMHRDAQGVYRDTDNRIIVADGGISLIGIDPYGGFLDWCDSQAIDYFVFGWDWRRFVAEAVDFFFDQFIPQFQAQVMAACGGVDPLANYSLVGHSFSGMFVNQALRRPQLPGNCTRMIAAAGLFHGYGGQIHRYFEKDSMFELYDDMEMIRVQTSLPGTYQLPFFSFPTFSAHKQKLGAPLLCALDEYPSTNVLTNMPADPYNPGVDSYPHNTGFDMAALIAAREANAVLSQPLPPGRQAIFTAIRGIVTDFAFNPVATTPGGVDWGPVANPYQPGQSPITDTANMQGDGTLPCWSTAMFDVKPVNILGPEVDHQFFLDIPEVQAEIGSLI